MTICKTEFFFVVEIFLLEPFSGFKVKAADLSTGQLERVRVPNIKLWT